MNEAKQSAIVESIQLPLSSTRIDQTDSFVRNCIDGSLDCVFVRSLTADNDIVHDVPEVRISNLVLKLVQFERDGKPSFEFELQYALLSKSTRTNSGGDIRWRLFDADGVALPQEYRTATRWSCNTDRVFSNTGYFDGYVLDAAKSAEVAVGLNGSYYRC